MPDHVHPTQSATVSSTAQTLANLGFTAEQITNARRAWVTGSGGDLRYRIDGTAPTAAIGHIIKDEVTTEFVENVHQLQLIRQSTDVTVFVELDTFTA